MVLIVFYLIIMPNKTQGALQANGDAIKTDTINNWMINIRKMQASGGTLGLTDTINNDLTSTNHNLDIHMEKNTEYGALAILSASSYGKPNKIQNGETTTGNATGVVMNINKEWVASGSVETGNYVKNFKIAKSRYKNIYKKDYVAKTGDAIGETVGWHGSNNSTWLNIITWSGYAHESGGLVRSISGSIFSYSAEFKQGSNPNSCSGVAEHKNKYSSRAVVVVGNGV